MNVKKRLALYGIFFAISAVTKIYAMNLSKPHDIFFRPPMLMDERQHNYYWVEYGIKQTSYACNGKTTNELTYLDCNQNALAMLNGFDDQSAIGQKRAQLPVVDDGVRGHYCVTGDFSIPFNMALAWRMLFTNDFSLGVYLPITMMKLKNVNWVNQTQMNDNQDALVADQLTNNFFNTVKTLGNGLELCNWDRIGVGDLEIILEFLRNFPQQKPMLKNVLVDIRAGLTFPSGKSIDVDKIATIPFGYDGATTVLFGGSIELLYGTWFKTGFDVELTHLFGNTKTRRFKTSVDQTEFLLLAKNRAYIDWGMRQQFTIYAELYHFLKGLSFKVGYRFFKQGDSVISLCGNTFSPVIANSAKSLEDWTAHDVLMKLSYDFSDDYDRVNPGFAIFARIPFDGKRSIVSNTVGVMASIDF